MHVWWVLVHCNYYLLVGICSSTLYVTRLILLSIYAWLYPFTWMSYFVQSMLFSLQGAVSWTCMIFFRIFWNFKNIILDFFKITTSMKVAHHWHFAGSPSLLHSILFIFFILYNHAWPLISRYGVWFPSDASWRRSPSSRAWNGHSRPGGHVQPCYSRCYECSRSGTSAYQDREPAALAPCLVP